MLSWPVKILTATMEIPPLTSGDRVAAYSGLQTVVKTPKVNDPFYYSKVNIESTKSTTLVFRQVASNEGSGC